MSVEDMASDGIVNSDATSMAISEGIAELPISERLISVAGEIFAKKGRQATVREICRAANCSIAAINYYFGDKNQLYLLCVRTACERKQKLFPLPDLGDADDPESAEKMLRSFLRVITSRMAAKSNLSWQNTLMLREVISPSEGVSEMLGTPFRRDFAALQSLLARLLGETLDSPALREQITTQIVARAMFLRTGKSLRKMFGIDSLANEDPVDYADTITDSILLQLEALRQRGISPPRPEERKSET